MLIDYEMKLTIIIKDSLEFPAFFTQRIVGAHFSGGNGLLASLAAVATPDYD